ncbi:hypothetical protein SLEP1_g24295 [Rubroshorea leprosula]|uniref:Uncharacterized protein n=1 Tax=Rubroshorea leprosula TaxID=152421 RepID=A0AAV5JSD2_9ROSI|nr:hypothetical protein SLEP1_g24295 [Rubroshorea leprosula]
MSSSTRTKLQKMKLSKQLQLMKSSNTWIVGTSQDVKLVRESSTLTYITGILK